MTAKVKEELLEGLEDVYDTIEFRYRIRFLLWHIRCGPPFSRSQRDAQRKFGKEMEENSSFYNFRELIQIVAEEIPYCGRRPRESQEPEGSGAVPEPYKKIFRHLHTKLEENDYLDTRYCVINELGVDREIVEEVYAALSKETGLSVDEDENPDEIFLV